MTADNTKLSVRVSPAYLHQIKTFALMQRMSISEVVKAAVEEYAKERGFRIFSDEELAEEAP